MPSYRDRITPRPNNPPLLQTLDKAVDAKTTRATKAARAAKTVIEEKDINITHARLQSELAIRHKLLKVNHDHTWGVCRTT
jgi:hypothetical protein